MRIRADPSGLQGNRNQTAAATFNLSTLIRIRVGRSTFGGRH